MIAVKSCIKFPFWIKCLFWAFLVWGKSIFLVTQIFSTPCSIKNKILGLINKYSFQRFSGFIISPSRALAKGRCYSHRQKAQLFVGSHIKKIREKNFSFVKKVFFYESMRFCVCWGFWVWVEDLVWFHHITVLVMYLQNCISRGM